MSTIHEDYLEAVRYIEETPKFTGKHALEETRRFLDELGAPDEGMRIIHVAGTNGKGSVCSYLKSILEASGYSVGMFISPHLVDSRERIYACGGLIPEEDFVRLFRTVSSKIGSPAGEDGNGVLSHPTYFEFYFYIGMLYFAGKRPDYIILETGMGGRLDATNTVRSKEVTVVTRIGLDHMAYLGGTVEEIAGEKAGIARQGVPLVVLGEPEEAFRVLKRRAVETDAPFYPVYDRETDGAGARFSGVPMGREGIDFSFSGRYHGNDFGVRAMLSTAAVYQRENCALSCMAALCLMEKGAKITRESMEEGVRSAFWAGRMQEIRPGFYIDGGHNPDGIAAFLESVRGLPCSGRRLLLFSVVSDKQYGEMAAQIRESGLFDLIVTAPLTSKRSLGARELDGLFSSRVIHADSVAEGLRILLGQQGENDLCFAAGSLYLVGQIMEETAGNRRQAVF